MVHLLHSPLYQTEWAQTQCSNPRSPLLIAVASCIQPWVQPYRGTQPGLIYKKTKDSICLEPSLHRQCCAIHVCAPAGDPVFAQYKKKYDSSRKTLTRTGRFIGMYMGVEVALRCCSEECCACTLTGPTMAHQCRHAQLRE